MEWIVPDKKDKAIVEEIENESDRGLIIVGVSYLETRLEDVIKTVLIPNISAKDNGRMFKGYGPLSSFSAKIDLGYLLQFYPMETRTLLHKLRELRNDAAHERRNVSFKDQSTIDRTNNIITLLEAHVVANSIHQRRLIAAVLARNATPHGYASYSVRAKSARRPDELDESARSGRGQISAAIQFLLRDLQEIESLTKGYRLVLQPASDVFP